MKPRPFVRLVLCKIKIILIFNKEMKGSLIVTVKVWGGVRSCFSPSRQIYLYGSGSFTRGGAGC